MPFELVTEAQFIEPITTRMLELIKRDAPIVFALPDVNKGQALPIFKEYLEVRKNEPHSPFVVVQATSSVLDRDKVIAPMPQSLMGISAVDETHRVTVFIGNDGADENLVVKQQYRYARGTDMILTSAAKTGELFDYIPSNRRGDLDARVLTHIYGQVGYDSTNYQFLTSLPVAISLIEG